MPAETPFARLGKKLPLVSDGAIGTMLIDRGLKAGLAPESFNLENTEALEDVARLYFDAGADIVHTNTFGGSRLKLASHHLGDHVEAVNRNAIAAVKKVAPKHGVVSVSCGPTGLILKPYGDADPEAVYESFRQQLTIAVDVGADAVTVETMIDIEEAKLAVEAAKSVSDTIPIMATMTFDDTPKGFFTIMGVSIEKAAQELEAAGADIVGSNCGNGIETMVTIAREFKNVTDMPLLIQANAGLPELRDGSPIYPETPDFMAEKAKELAEMGVAVIGGCCGTTPQHTKALKKMLDSRV
jgi:5-methyltetrahydrofolate--homocysteine methyltransferase